ncbi:MAG: preprotein translocase subunit Sec61beta [Candidatus Micrarchaeota archaeon]|nr:preprotein translocase subunit Sec61beta [Candidatus Micrarchaeota archaeon]
MPGLGSPQTQAGVLSFYDAQTKGPKMNPKVVLIAVAVFSFAVLVIDHFLYYAA